VITAYSHDDQCLPAIDVNHNENRVSKISAMINHEKYEGPLRNILSIIKCDMRSPSSLKNRDIAQIKIKQWKIAGRLTLHCSKTFRETVKIKNLELIHD
jgi:hypothetical protein